MTPDFVVAARAEAATLERRLTAVKALIAAYDDGIAGAPQFHEKTAEASIGKERKQKPSVWGERPKDQFSPYGKSIVDAAVSVVSAAPQLPIKTRDIAASMHANGVEIRGNDPVNALGALLARSSALESQGKQGWTLAKPFVERSPNETAPPSTIFDDVLGGADTAAEAQHGGPQE